MPENRNYSSFIGVSTIDTALSPHIIQKLQDFYQQRKLSKALDALKDCEIYGDDALEVLGAIAPVSEEVDA